MVRLAAQATFRSLIFDFTLQPVEEQEQEPLPEPEP